jgi:hyperosmotically inducible periplasmic protein
MWHSARFSRDRMNRKLATFVLVAVTGFVAPVVFVGCASSDDRDSHKRTAGQYVDDKVLIQRVKGALDNNDVYKFPDVKVNTYKGTVQLSGFVATDEQKRQAEQIARNVQGVYNIQNNIAMKSDTERVRGTSDTTVTNRPSTTPTAPTPPPNTTTPTPTPNP